MAQLHVALQDGFEGEEVVVEINDCEVFRKAGVRTRTQISLADSFEVPLPDGPATVRLRVPSRGVSHETVLPADPPPAFLGLSLLPGGEVGERVSSEMMGHM